MWVQILLTVPNSLVEDAMSTLYRQVELINGKQVMVCWLPTDRVSLRPGIQLTIEGDDHTLWRVSRVYGLAVPKECLRKSWKVGGLS